MDAQAAEAKLRKLMTDKTVMTKAKAVEALATMLLAGRIRKPTSGGPPPAIGPGDDDRHR